MCLRPAALNDEERVRQQEQFEVLNVCCGALNVVQKRIVL